MQIKLSEIAGGRLQEKADRAIQDIVNNMLDPNTPWNTSRSLNIKLKFSQNEERDDLKIEIGVEKKLANVKPIVTQAYVGKDLDTGKVYLEEYGNQVHGQMSFGDMEPVRGFAAAGGQGRQVDRDTGEIAESGVIDLQRRVQ